MYQGTHQGIQWGLLACPLPRGDIFPPLHEYALCAPRALMKSIQLNQNQSGRPGLPCSFTCLLPPLLSPTQAVSTRLQSCPAGLVALRCAHSARQSAAVPKLGLSLLGGASAATSLCVLRHQDIFSLVNLRSDVCFPADCGVREWVGFPSLLK